MQGLIVGDMVRVRAGYRGEGFVFAVTDVVSSARGAAHYGRNYGPIRHEEVEVVYFAPKKG